MSMWPRLLWPAVKTMLHSVYDQSDATTVHVQLDSLLDSRADTLPFTVLPKNVWTHVCSNNPDERLNCEIRRHTAAVGIFSTTTR